MGTEPIMGFAALYSAWRRCRRSKRGTRKAQRYETRLLDNLVETAQALQTQHWRPSRAIRFVVIHPKPREILAAEFGDRVVHHLLVPWFERLFEPVFIHDSFANRKGKGSHAAVDRLQHFTRCAPGAHYLQLDIANYFNRINRRALFDLLQQRVIRDQRRRPSDPRYADPSEAASMLWLARVLLTGNPAQTALFQGSARDAMKVPPHKQLGNAPAETGLAIGNLTSQFFANVYLNELDQFVKHTLKARFYVRYVDDFVLLHPDPQQLIRWRDAIAEFLRAQLGLALRDQGQLAPIGNGIDFLGYIIRPQYRLVRRRILGHMRERLARHARVVQHGQGLIHLPPGQADAVQAMLASYLGHYRHAHTARLIRAIFQHHAWLTHLLRCTDGKPPQLIRVDRPASVTSLASQWRYFQARYPDAVILMQVGNRLESYTPRALTLSLPGRVQSVDRPRIGQGLAWPLIASASLRRRLCRLGIPFCQIAEQGWLKGGMKRRELRWVHVIPLAVIT